MVVVVMPVLSLVVSFFIRGRVALAGSAMVVLVLVVVVFMVMVVVVVMTARAGSR